MMRKKHCSILLIFLSFLLLGGCVSKNPSDNNLDTFVFSPYFKPDVMAEDGKKAALSDERIWYLSAESGEQGLHSMALDGSDVRLEFATEDIRSLTVRDGVIWTAEFVGMDENHCGEFRMFQPFLRQDGADGAAENLLDGVDISLLKSIAFWKANVWDFYVASDQRVIFRFTYPDQPTGGVDYFTCCLQIEEAELKNIFDGNQKTIIDGPPLFESYYYGDQMQIIYQANCVECLGGIYDLDRHRTAFGTVPRTSRDGYSFMDIAHVKDNALYFIDVDKIQWLSTDPVDAGVVTAFDGEEKIYAGYHTDDTHLLLTRKNVEKERFLRPNKLIRSDKTLYRLDLETGEREQLLTIELPADFVYLDENYAATAEGKTLTLYDIRGEEAQEIRKIELDHKIVDKANKTDAAGGWWFLYRFNEKTNRDELIEKVRLF